jgi:hypothetical protein
MDHHELQKGINMTREEPKQGMGETFRENTRVAVETAAELSRGAKRDKWETYRSRMKDKIALWQENVPPSEGAEFVKLSGSQPGNTTTPQYRR